MRKWLSGWVATTQTQPTTAPLGALGNLGVMEPFGVSKHHKATPLHLPHVPGIF